MGYKYKVNVLNKKRKEIWRYTNIYIEAVKLQRQAELEGLDSGIIKLK